MSRKPPTPDPLFEQTLYFWESRRKIVELRLDPPKDPRRKKRASTKSKWHNSRNLLLLVASLHPDAPDFYAGGEDGVEDFLELATEAVKCGDTEFWKAVAEFTIKAKNTFNQPIPESPLPIYAIRAKIILHYRTGRLPTKAEIKNHLIAAATKQRFKCYGADESSRWNEVFRAAGLTFLPNSKPKRGLIRNGG